MILIQIGTSIMLYPLALLIPLFLLLIFLEWKHENKHHSSQFEWSNISNNMAIGAIDQFSSFGYLFLLYGCLNYIKTHFAFFNLENNILQWVLAFLAVDFTSYWYHRFSHKVNLLWAGHITHHSSEYFNFSNGFRTSPFQGLFRIIFWLWMPVLGFDPLVLVLCFQVSGLHDFLVHTESVKNLGWLENIIVTPSHHRVHHGKNELYIDKNFSSFFIFWDKLFGTFQKETETVEYGVKGNFIETGPINSIFFYFRYLIASVQKFSHWENKFKIFFMPPDWIPDEKSAISLKQKQLKIKWFSREIALLLLFLGAVSTIVFLYLGRTLNPWIFALGIFLTLFMLISATIRLKSP